MSASGAGRIDPRALDGAVEWFLRLTSGTASQADHEAWQAWRRADPEHERAWLRTEALTRRFEALPKGVLPVLGQPRSAGRRRALGKLVLLASAGGAGWLAYRDDAWRGWTAQYRTAVGARREVMLADHSRIVLNAATAMDVLFDARQRLIALHAGEILVETSPDPAPVARPFIVRTREGSITALGTRFVVRRDDGVSTVQVLDGAVRVAPRGAASDRARQVPAGMSLRFGDGIDEGLAPVAGDPSAWQRGMLQVDGMPLRTFLAELQRYRSGWIDCAPEVAHLPISGAFPLEDTDRVLATVADTLPLRLRYRTRYWVSVLPRGASGTNL
ncbi:MAG: FecR domain-containing protein [Achromobacter sp.]|uniref:Protein FecR n=1 Tax=Achromobacter insuavis TaxID=1287735 RepID=A0A6J4ZH88_9BURK|nr:MULTISPECIES: FecR domain-containing protein [Achromobacter]MBN9640059.1 FecR domain-containing protein [Achromobacter sp.]CAB3623935.1 Protein FecR [Achromobacter insuavis]CAB3819272.1 Protein FecR [Achromobacter insuavis]CUJ65432.1 fec operon regulator FecR [Achromobacter sp. 2789STDY5608633]CUJ80269.1 fec operon regulator FecR [Achromobacter sp. 2789STDY5608628]